jgi:hypothetical protein
VIDEDFILRKIIFGKLLCALVMALGFMACAAQASDAFSRIIQPIRPGISSYAAADASASERADADGQDIAIQRYQADWVQSGAADARREWFYSLSYSAFEIDGGLSLPDSGVRIDDPLQDVELGLGYRAARGMDVYGAFANFGSASDKPFDSYDETSLMLNAFYNRARSRSDSWLFMLNYSNRRSFLTNVPLLGAAYVHAPDRRTMFVLGLPFLMLRYPLGARVDVSLNYFVPDQVKLEGAVNLWRGLSAVAGFSRDEDSFFIARREKSGEHLYYEESRVYSGLRFRARAGLRLALTVGYGLDRRFYQGEDGDSERDRVGLDEAADIGFSISRRF